MKTIYELQERDNDRWKRDHDDYIYKTRRTKISMAGYFNAAYKPFTLPYRVVQKQGNKIIKVVYPKKGKSK